MSIDDATPEEWDALNKKDKDSELDDFFKKGNGAESCMDRFLDEAAEDPDWVRDLIGEDGNLVYNGIRKDSPIVYTDDAEDFADCWADDVNNPVHYNLGNIECIEAIKESMSVESFRGYLKGNCMKYLWRYDYKGKALQDCEKAQWYLNKLIEELRS